MYVLMQEEENTLFCLLEGLISFYLFKSLYSLYYLFIDLIWMFGCHMCLQVVHTSKLHKTNLASKRFLSCVNKQMPLKQGTFLKGFQTDLTLKTS